MDDTNVINFPRIGLRPPVDAAGSPVGGTVVAEEPGETVSFPQIVTRRMTPPALLPIPAATADAGPAPGTTGAASASARDMAALSMVTLAAISVAALRGTYHVVSWIKARAEHHRTVKASAQGAGGTGGKPGRVQSGPEFGRTSAKSGPSGKSGGSVGGSGRRGGGVPASFRSGKPPASGATKRSQSTAPKSRAGGSGPSSRSRKGPAGGKSTPRTVKQRSPGASKAARPAKVHGKKGPGGGSGPGVGAAGKPRSSGRMSLLKKKRGAAQPGSSTKPGKKTSPKSPKGAKRTGAGRTSLPAALKNDLKKAAGRRWKRRKKTMVKPPVWAAPKKSQTKAKQPGPAGKGSAGAKKGGTATGPGRKKTSRRSWKHPKTTPFIWKAAKAGAKKAKPAGSPRASKFRSGAWARWERLKAKARKPSTGQPSSSGPHASGTPGGSSGPTAGRGRPTPPPGMSVPYTVILTRADQPTRTPAARGATARPTGAAIAPARAALAAGTTTKGTRVTALLHQPSADSDLTIYDLIDADADAAREILDRIDEANAVAGSTEGMYHHLENLKAKIHELKVPGLLVGYVNRLMEKCGEVRASAQALAAALPGASETISTAGDNAAARHKNLADVTRDMGHAAPAEAEYHKE